MVLLFMFHRTRVLFAVQACVYLPYTLFLKWSSHIKDTYRKFSFNVVSSVIYHAITTWRDIFFYPYSGMSRLEVGLFTCVQAKKERV